MPFSGTTFSHLYDWVKDPQRNEKIYNNRLEDEFDGIDAALSTIATSLIRERLTANRNYYVNASTGNNSNTGLSSGAAFATIQKAIDTVAQLDLGIYNVDINLADGTYGGFTATGSWLGSGRVFVVGNTATPANVVINSTVVVSTYCLIQLSGMELRNAAGNVLTAFNKAAVTFGSAIRFGATNSLHVYADTGSSIVFGANYSIVGNAVYHLYLANGAICQCAGLTVTLTGTPAFTVFALATELADIQIFSNTYSGAATGTRYSVSMNSVINTAGGGATYLPGNVAGATATGGQYV
jgi:hypothetical protein